MRQAVPVIRCAADVAELAAAPDAPLGDWHRRGGDSDYIELERDGTYLVLVWPGCWRDGQRMAPHLVRARSGNFGLLVLGDDDQFAEVQADQFDAPGMVLVPAPLPLGRLRQTLDSAASAVCHRRLAGKLSLELEQSRYEASMLIKVGRALSQHRELPSLLKLILRRTRDVTDADAGSIYVVEGDSDNDDVTKRCLVCQVSQNDSVPIESRTFTLPVTDRSIVGSAVIERKAIEIKDLYKDTRGYEHNRTFDDAHGYQTRSMLTVPMISARQQVIGVIQLINRRARGYTRLTRPEDFERGVLPFNDVTINYATSLASLAGIALENAMLYDEVQTLFDGFVHASVTAIEARDPTTSGHSERVAILTVGLAEAAERADSGRFADLSFSKTRLKQIEYAALLHDFGKVGVREHVLVKAKKLYQHEGELIHQRFDFIKKTLENEVLSRKVAYLLQESRERSAAELAGHMARMEDDLAQRIAEIDEFLTFVMTANQPTVLERGGFERIRDIANHQYTDGRGRVRPYLTQGEAEALQILRGSLTGPERHEIQSHVVHTIKFLQQIPWGRTFRDIPTIAGGHHEKLDGSGYPHGLVGDAIPIETRMMTISDIYDALTASDRPYKKAMPAQRALDILHLEVKDGKLDRDVLDLFIAARVYERGGSDSR